MFSDQKTGRRQISAHLYRQNAQNREADLMDLFPDLKTKSEKKKISANWAKVMIVGWRNRWLVECCDTQGNFAAPA